MAALIRTLMRQGVIPIVDQMSAAGVITLRSIMAGRLLSGMEPVEVAEYQILLLFVLTGASGMAAAGAVYPAENSLTEERQRLRAERLR